MTSGKPSTKSKNQDHEMLVQLQCELCEKLFSNLTSLKNHWKEHSNMDVDDSIPSSKDTDAKEGPILLEVEEQSYIIEYT